MRAGLLSLIVLVAAPCPLAAAEATSPLVQTRSVRIQVDPPEVRLHGPEARFSLLVDGFTADGAVHDLTGNASYRSLTPEVCEVSAAGVIRPVADGRGVIEVTVSGKSQSVPVHVSGAAASRTYNFENDIIPLFTRFGCNMSGCHGKAEGQNGFKLSVFGFDPEADYSALLHEARGRRVFPAVPDQSLLLLKASGGMPHGGGIRMPRSSRELKLIRDWIAAGMPFGDPDDPKVVSIAVMPRERTMRMEATQQLRVVATYSDGRTEDVTAYARFQSNNEALGSVNENGLVTIGDLPGEVAVMANYMGAVDIFQAFVPRPEKIAFPQLAETNFIDGHVWRKLRKLNIAPSAAASDAEYLRRVYLDIIGTLPTAEETRAFLAETAPDRRARLVDQLLKRPEFADYWALRWADLLRVDRQALGHKGAYAYYRWIRDSIAANVPYDEFVRGVITAEGPLTEAPAGHLYKAVTKPGDRASTVSQVFLGVRIECAQCHHHPFDRWTQTDYAGMQAFFTPVNFKKSPRGEMLIADGGGTVKHPRTGEPVFAHALGTSLPERELEGDRRQVLADWMTAPENPWLARALVNRVWAHFLGRGLIEPVDDLRLTNPPTNPELLDALAADFIAHDFDFQHLIRTITASQVYQLSSQPNETNERDQQNYSRALWKRLDAEVLFDAVCQTTGIDEKFEGVPAGYRAIQLWDSKVRHYFLKLFGRPERLSACECERTVEPSVAQVLHVLNSPEIHAKLSHDGGRIRQLVDRWPDDRALVEELYLTFYSRFPTAEERQIATEYLQSQGTRRRQAAEDLAWSLLNTVEFLFNH